MDEVTKENYRKLISEITNAGYPITEILDIRYLYNNYSDAIPILLKWLPIFYDLDVREEIVRALAVKFAKSAGNLLIEEFKKAAILNNKSYAWAIGNSISFFADDSLIDEIAVLVKNKSYSIARQMLTEALGKIKTQKSKEILIELLQDDVVAGHAIRGLRKMNALDTRKYIEPFLDHPRTWWRNEAKKTIIKFDNEINKV